MLGGGGNPAAWLEIDGARSDPRRARHGDRPDRPSRRATTTSGSRSRRRSRRPADVWWAPVETISNSEAGFERVYQGAGLLLSWPLSLAAGASRTVTVRQAVTTARDRAEEERADAAGADGGSGGGLTAEAADQLMPTGYGERRGSVESSRLSTP